MTDIASPIVTSCPHPECGAPIREDHPYAWCTACGQALPEAIQQRLPRLRDTRLRGEAARKSLGAPAMVEEVCRFCGTRFLASRQRDALGFRELTCPHCGQITSLPLTWGYRLTYWFFLLVIVHGAVRRISEAGWAAGVESSFVLTILLLRAIIRDLKNLYARRRARA